DVYKRQTEGRLLLARYWIATLGTLTVVAIFFVGRRWYSSSLGLLSAFFLSIMPLHILCSHYVKEDVPMLFWLTVALVFFIRYAQDQKNSLAALSGFFSGMATSTKYFALVTLPIFLIELMLLYRGKIWKKYFIISSIIFLAMLVLGFILFTPFAVLDYPGFIKGFFTEFEHSRTGHESQPVSPWRYAWSFHLQRSLIPGVTLPLLLLGITGMIVAWRNNGTVNRLLCIATLLLYFLIEGSPLKAVINFERYALPLLLFLALFGAYTIIWLFQLSGRISVRSGVIVLFLVISFVALLRAVKVTSAMSPDTREIAASWIVRNIPLKSRILVIDVQSYNPNIYGLDYPLEKGRRDWDGFLKPGFLKRFDYVIVSSFLYERHFTLYPKKTPMYYFYQHIFDNWKLVKEIKPRYFAYGYHNPTIRIYARP
ncbi:MAG: glycosyltransferase family 39 protein, partial [Candidatus Sumerlaeia bacterium]|nr:glycosyltransferase family 39 protein [Candidatus Sumerlaeia bacterium]